MPEEGKKVLVCDKQGNIRIGEVYRRFSLRGFLGGNPEELTWDSYNTSSESNYMWREMPVPPTRKVSQSSSNELEYQKKARQMKEYLYKGIDE